jgi:hypothetical protein
MLKPVPLQLRFTVLGAALALAACGTGGGNEADANLVGNDADPALTSALEDQILVDPTLAQQSNRNAVRPPETPTQAQYPVAGGSGGAPARPAPAVKGGGGAGVNPQAALAGGANCADNAKFDYNMAWANRLSPAFPILPGAKITEAAANNQGDCRVRVVTFTSNADFQRVLDWYNTRAVQAGYSSEHQVRDGDHILAGAKAADGGAYYLIVTPKGRGSEVALIANKGV